MTKLFLIPDFPH